MTEDRAEYKVPDMAGVTIRSQDSRVETPDRLQFGLAALAVFIAIAGVGACIAIIATFGKIEIPGQFGISRYIRNDIAYWYGLAAALSGAFWCYLLLKLRRVLVNQAVIVELLRRGR